VTLPESMVTGSVLPEMSTLPKLPMATLPTDTLPMTAALVRKTHCPKLGQVLEPV